MTVAAQLSMLRKQLELISRELELSCDRDAMEHILTTLVWATENCSVIAKHQIGKSLGDTMGY